jgi:hypothetical protein
MKNIYYYIVALTVCLLSQSCQEDKKTGEKVISHFTVMVGDFERTESVASVALDEITHSADSNLVLYEILKGERVQTDIQFEISGNKRYMYWILNGNSQKGTRREYELVKEESKYTKKTPPVSIINQDGGYEFIFKGKKVLKYNSQIVLPPKGVDISYSRSGFINPLYAPNQAILTRIPDSTSDHLHHYGLWNAWKKVQFRGKDIDFFAPQFGQGTVRHTGVISKNEGAVFGSLSVLLEHVVWQDSVQETIAMRELMDVKVYNHSKDYFLIDISFRYNPTEHLLIKEYGYAGFSFRATDYWRKGNTRIFTSEGLERDQADGERSKWCVVTGETPEGTASILFMGHPANYNHPEPMRIWPSNANKGLGNVYINYSPTRNTDWALEPENSYLLRYRLLITNSAMNTEEAQGAWNEYANPPRVHMD